MNLQQFDHGKMFNKFATDKIAQRNDEKYCHGKYTFKFAVLFLSKCQTFSFLVAMATQHF